MYRNPSYERFPDLQPNRPSKRRRLSGYSESNSASGSGGSSQQPASQNAPPTIASIDLTEVEDKNSLEQALAKQRSDAIKAQNGSQNSDEARSTLTAYKCPVCMDTPTDATTTSCGHIFCHRCIHDALRVGERRHVDDGHSAKTAKGNCPVCRTPLSRAAPAHTKKGLIPLEMKLKLTVRKRVDIAKADKGKGRVTVVGSTQAAQARGGGGVARNGVSRENSDGLSTSFIQ